MPLKPSALMNLSSAHMLQSCSIVQLSCLPAATEARFDPGLQLLQPVLLLVISCVATAPEEWQPHTGLAQTRSALLLSEVFLALWRLPKHTHRYDTLTRPLLCSRAEAGSPCAAEAVARQAKAGAALPGREAGAALAATGAQTAAQMQACMAAGAWTAASSRPAGAAAWEVDLAGAKLPAADLMGPAAGAALASVAGDFLAGAAYLRRPAQTWGWARELP